MQFGLYSVRSSKTHAVRPFQLSFYFYFESVMYSKFLTETDQSQLDRYNTSKIHKIGLLKLLNHQQFLVPSCTEN